jgi:FkbM family methyltransferase
MIDQTPVPLKDKLLTRYYQAQWRGFSRTWEILKSWGGKPYLLASSKYGTQFYLDPQSYIDSHVLRAGYYESEIMEAILPFLGANSVFWDIGANFGLHAITAKFLKPEAQVICIEPSPLMATQLRANCRLNRLDITLVNLALAETARLQTLHLMDGNPGMTTLKPWEKAQYSDSIICWCETGDNLVTSHHLPQPTIIKIDVEGMELEVLLGMETLLNNEALKAVILEGDRSLVTTVTHPLRQLLSSHGFKLQSLSRQEETHHNLENFIALR